jgi:hypothetical protein
MFQEEKPHLLPLPLLGMQYFTEAQYTVNDDSCVRVAHSSYAARPAAIGTRVLVRLFARRLEIRDLKTQALLRTHDRAERPGTVVLPMNERVFNPSRETQRILSQAKAIGAATHKLCETLFEREGRVGQRKLWGIVGLVRRYPRRLIESACERAMQEGVYSYGHVKTLTQRLMEEALTLLDAPTSSEGSLTQSHALIRAGDDYADLFTLGAQQSATLTLTESVIQTKTQNQVEATV